MEYTPEAAVLTLVKSCASVSCLINMEPLELLRLQPSELIPSESVSCVTDSFLLTYTHQIALLIKSIEVQGFLSPLVHIAQWAHMRRFLSVCHTFHISESIIASSTCH